MGIGNSCTANRTLMFFSFTTTTAGRFRSFFPLLFQIICKREDVFNFVVTGDWIFVCIKCFSIYTKVTSTFKISENELNCQSIEIEHEIIGMTYRENDGNRGNKISEKCLKSISEALRIGRTFMAADSFHHLED